MRALSTCIILFAAFGLTACNSLNASNVPSGRYGDTSYGEDESVVVGSLAIEDVRNDFHDGDEVIFFFNAYDPESNRLIPDGESFLFVRETCVPRGVPRCDMTQPYHQIVTVPPGHYVLTMSVVNAKDSRAWKEFYVPSNLTFWTHDLKPDASLQGTKTIKIEVLPNETVYFGELMLHRPGDSKQMYTLEGTVGRDDAAASAALEAAGYIPMAMVYRPAT